MKRNPIETAAGETFGGDPEPVYARPFNWRLICALFAIEAVAVGVFVWMVMA